MKSFLKRLRPGQRLALKSTDLDHALRFHLEPLEQRTLLSTVQVIAAGTVGDEIIELQIDGAVVQSWNDLGDRAWQRDFVTRSFSTQAEVVADQVRINFTNAVYIPDVIDRNVRIDAIIIDGTRYETESPDVYSTGTWKPGQGVQPGYHESEILHNNGYFQYSSGPANPGNGSLIEIRASGDEGGERFGLQIDGQAVGNWTVTTEFQTFSYIANDEVIADQVRIEFTNPLWQPGVIDRNLNVDYIAIDGVVFETEDPSVYSTGTWLPGDGINPGYRQSETLHTGGYFQYASAPVNPGNGSLIEIRASGDEGGERFGLQIDGQTVGNWTVTTEFQTFSYTANNEVIADQVRIEFTNPLWQPGVIDRNLNVDYIVIDGVVFETEDPSVYSTGTWLPGDGINPGYRQSETLHTRGYFQYAGDADPPGSSVMDELNDVLPDGWTYQLFNDGLNLRLQTYDADGNAANAYRFGSTGVISEIRDSRNGQNLLAPSYQGEVTDRVIQWTFWEVGQTAVYDHPSLGWVEDRFNLTQAGTFYNALNETVDVDMVAATGQLDVWSVVDRQWRAEQDPFMQGEITALTRMQVLDGGAIMVRRVLMIHETYLQGQEILIANPYLVGWNTFADNAFNSLALGIDSQGNPNHWYAEGVNIPHFPNTPVSQTRGWAMVYDRFNLNSGATMSVVYGKDQGTVHLPDGSTADPRWFNYNSMDFDGGIAINPGMATGTLPVGSIIDQTYILLPGQGIEAGTAQILDGLAATMPGPQVYHPGAAMDPELAEIANRLATLANESGAYTDNLGPLA